MQGLHLTADGSGCPSTAPALRQPEALRALCLAAVAQAGLTPVGELFHRFDPATGGSAERHGSHGQGGAGDGGGGGVAGGGGGGGDGGVGGGGVTGVVLLAESHLAVHTWPELGAVTLDVYVCNFGADNSTRAELLMRALLAALQPSAVDRQRLERGRCLPAA